MKPYRLSLPVAAFALLAAPSFAQKPAATVAAKPKAVRAATPPAAAAPSVRARIDAVLAVPALRNAVVGVYVRSLDDGRVLYERNADTSLMPASNEKILTSATAFARLTPAFRYTTTLYRTGTVGKDGALKGDLYLKGTGDPSLDSAKLLAAAQALKASGITRFSGKIIADASRFGGPTLGDGWQGDDEAAYYSAQFSALNCDENVLLVEVQPAETVGSPAKVIVGGKDADVLGFRDTMYVAVKNQVTTVAAPVAGTDAKPTGRVTFDRTRGRNEVVVAGTVPLNGIATRGVVTVEDPARFTATRLYELMAVAGIQVPGADRRVVEVGAVPADAVVAHEITSDDLGSLVRHFLKTSDNLYGECLLRTLGAEKGTVGTASGGAAVVRDFLKEMGVSDAGLFIADGSGLSRMNTVTPRLLVDLFTAIDKKWPAELKDAYVKALPEGGLDGTLRNRFKGTPAEGKVHAKTGTLFGVSGLSGFLTTAAGERLAFSLLLNHFAAGGRGSDAKGAEDAVVLALMDTPKPRPDARVIYRPK